MSINAKRLDRTIVIRRRVEVLDARGTPLNDQSWVPVATLRAQRLENGSREFVRAYGQATEGEAVFRVRYVAGITTADRILFEGEELELVEVVELGRRSGLDLRTKTQQVAP